MRHDLPLAEQLFDELADAVYLLDPDTSQVLWANRAAWAGLGLTRQEVLGHSVLSLQKDVLGMPQWAEIAQVIRNQTPYVFVGRHRHRDGHEVPVEVVTTAFEQDGREFFLSVARDITRRVALDGDLRSRQPALWFALNEAADGLWDWDLVNNTLFFSPQLKRMLGYGPEEMAPVIDTWVNNLHPDDAPRVRRILQEHLAGHRVRYVAEYRLRNRNGHYLWVRDQGSVSERDAQGAPTRVVGMVQDVTEQKLLQFKLESWATNDALTGLPNRRHGEEYLQSQLALARRNGTPLGVCFVDLDYFKTINDKHGHLKGDEVLRAAAQAMASGVRRSDMVLRWGGEEFVIVCPGAGVNETLQVAAKARAALAALPWQESLSVPPVTASFGVAVFPEHGDGSDELVEAADSALYRAKAGQRDRIELAQSADDC